jgi:hypothetical protein
VERKPLNPAAVQEPGERVAELLERLEQDASLGPTLAALVAEWDVRAEVGTASAVELGALLQAGVELGDRGIEALDGHGGFAAAKRAAAVLGDIESGAWVHWREACALRRSGAFARCRTLLDQALVEFGASESGRPWLQIERAELLRALGDWSAALSDLDAARAALSAEPCLVFEPEHARAMLHGAYGQLYIELGLPDRARGWLALEERAAKQSGDTNAWLAAQLHAANLELLTDDFAGLAERVERTLASGLPEAALRGVRGQLLLRLGLARSEESRLWPEVLPRAREAFEQALALPQLASDERERAELFLAELELREGRLAPARARIERVARASSAAQAGARDGAQDGVQDGPHARTTALLDDTLLGAILRARLALQSGATVAELAAVEADLCATTRRCLAAWEAAPRRDGGLGLLRTTRRRALWIELVRVELALHEAAGPRRALDWLAAAQQQATLLQRLESSRADGDSSVASEAAPAVVASAAAEFGEAPEAPLVGCAAPPEFDTRWIAEGCGALQFLPGPERSYVFLVDATSVDIVELPARVALERLRRAVADPLLRGAEPDSASVGALAAALFPARVAAFVAGHSSVLCSGLEALGYVPVELLPGPSGAPLGLERPLYHAPSLALARTLGARAALGAQAHDRFAAAGVDVLVCIASDPGDAARARFPELALLPAAERHADEVRARFAPARVAVLVGAAATRQRLEIELAQHPRALFVWAHGVRDGTRELQLGVALAPQDGAPAYWWSHELEQQPLPPLVVFATCGAARGPDRPGDEGIAHLGGAALSAGARCVLLPVASIGYRATQVVLAEFEQQLTRGLAPLEALHAARRAASAQGLAGHEWAALQLYGSAGEPLFDAAQGVATQRATAASSQSTPASPGATVGLAGKEREEGGQENATSAIPTRIALVVVGLIALALAWKALQRRSSVPH